MMPFRASIKGHMEKIGPLDVRIIAPSHGPVYNNPAFILGAYQEWISDSVKNQVVIPYISMHGSTRKMVDHLTDALIERGIEVKPFDLTVVDTGNLAMSLVDAATVVIATPTVLFGPHPQVVYATYLANMLHPKVKFASIIGSYGWGGKTTDVLKAMMTHIKPELLEPVMVQGLPGEKLVGGLDRLARRYCRKTQRNRHTIISIGRLRIQPPDFFSEVSGAQILPPVLIPVTGYIS